MSFYNQSVKTHVVNPVYHSNARTELRLSDLFYFSNMRLTKVGAVVTGEPSIEYTTQAGALGMVKNAQLYSAGTLIESVTDVHLLSAFNTMKKSNGACGSLTKFLTRTAQGSSVEEEEGGLIFDTGYPDTSVTNVATTTSEAWFDLREIFGVLRSASFINCEKLHNLRIVIEWRSDFQNLFVGDMSGLTACNIVQPELIVDEVTSQKTIDAIKLFTAANKQVPFFSMESDAAVISACANNATVAQQFIFNAFQGKFVERLLLLPYEATSGYAQVATNVTKIDKADVFKFEVWQVQLNNVNMLDYYGADTSARKLALLVDSHGDLCMPYGSNEYAILRSANMFVAGSIALRLIGKCGYFGITLSDRVSKLQVTYQRTGFVDHPAAVMRAYGEVYKAIQYTDDGFNVVYL